MAAKVLKANYLWLDRFEEIVLWFDNDEPGQAAADECARLLKSLTWATDMASSSPSQTTTLRS
jgi:hypothetical protein